MSKPIMLFLNGESGTGKTFFKENIVPSGAFYNLISATTRGRRPDEVDGVSYYFRDEDWFENERANDRLATYLFVNESFWKPGDKKWLYGVPANEIYSHIGQNLIYDVIEPRYTREMIDWFKSHHLDNMYDFRVAWFSTLKLDNMAIARDRAVMQNDLAVRQKNTCNAADFRAAGIKPDYITHPRDNRANPDLIKMVRSVPGMITNVKTVLPIHRSRLLQR